LTFGGKPIEIPLNYNTFLVSLPVKKMQQYVGVFTEAGRGGDPSVDG